MKYYITEYPVNNRIWVVDSANDPTSREDGEWLYIRTQIGWVFRKPYWHTTHADAVAQMERMRERAIFLAREEIKELEQLNFEECIICP